MLYLYAVKSNKNLFVNQVEVDRNVAILSTYSARFLVGLRLFLHLLISFPNDPDKKEIHDSTKYIVRSSSLLYWLLISLTHILTQVSDSDLATKRLLLLCLYLYASEIARGSDGRHR